MDLNFGLNRLAYVLFKEIHKPHLSMNFQLRWLIKDRQTIQAEDIYDFPFIRKNLQLIFAIYEHEKKE